MTSPMVKSGWMERYQREIDWVVCVGGIYLLFMLYAFLQEKLTTDRFGGERFGFTFFLICGQCIFNAVWSGAALALLRTPRCSMPHKSFVAMAVTYMGGMLASYWALDYISFPTIVLMKSCKFLAVIVMGALVYRKRYPLSLYLCAVAITIGIALFSLAGRPVEPPAVPHPSHAVLHPSTVLLTSAVGGALTLLSLAFDGATGSIQDRYLPVYRPSTHELMYGLNAWSVLLSGAVMLVSGEAFGALSFCQRHPEIVPMLLVFWVVSAVGQNFVFYSVHQFGALTTSLITTTRKFFTIIFSVFFFGHPVNALQWLGVVLVFGALAYDTYVKYRGGSTAGGGIAAVGPGRKYKADPKRVH